MNHTQITQCLKSIATILEVIAEDPGFQEIAANPYGHPNIDISLGDAQHYVDELIYRLNYQHDREDELCHEAQEENPLTKDYIKPQNLQ